MSFEIGVVVQLKSGGPKMTVSAVEEGMVKVDWFDRAGKSFSKEFRTEQLQLVLDELSNEELEQQIKDSCSKLLGLEK